MYALHVALLACTSWQFLVLSQSNREEIGGGGAREGARNSRSGGYCRP